MPRKDLLSILHEKTQEIGRLKSKLSGKPMTRTL